MATIQMLKNTYWGDANHPARTLLKGGDYTVPEDIAQRWITRKIAVPVDSTGEVIAQAPAAPKRVRVGGGVPGVSGLINR